MDAVRRAQEADRILHESNAILSGDRFVNVTGEHGADLLAAER